MVNRRSKKNRAHLGLSRHSYLEPLSMLQIPVENQSNFEAARQGEGMCHFTSRALKNPLLILLVPKCRNDPFWTKTVHCCPEKRQNCHIASVSCMYGAGVRIWRMTCGGAVPMGAATHAVEFKYGPALAILYVKVRTGSH